jgi:Helix-hairpin-helix motif
MPNERAPAVAFVAVLGLLWSALPLVHRADQPAPAPPPRTGAARLLWGLPLDLNREDERTLEVLPGIGPTRARAIRAARPFCRVSELRRVGGIGPVTLSRLAGQVSVTPPRPLSCRD